MIDFSSFHKLSYGLYLICSEFDGKKAGYAGNTGFQLTAEPSTIAVSCNKKNFTSEIISQSKKFSLSVLQKDLDIKIIQHFGFKTSKETDKFKDHEYKTGELEIPVMTDSCVAAFECEVIDQVDCGTHILFVGKVIVAEKLNDQAALTYEYYHEHYKMLAPENAPTYIDPEKLEDKKEETADESKKENEATSEAAEYVCQICGYTYDPEEGAPEYGIPAGTPFEDLPEEFVCPICAADKSYFNET